MNRNNFSPTLLIILSLCIGCSRDTSTAESSGFLGSLKSEDGKLVSFDPDPSDQIFAVASWCPHSATFIRLLREPFVQEALGDKRVIFILEDEWPALSKMLDDRIRRGENTEADRPFFEKRFHEASKDLPVVLGDPAFLDRLPGTYYFSSVRIPMPEDRGFPARYSAKTLTFDAHATQALEDMGVPSHLIARQYETYERLEVDD